LSFIIDKIKCNKIRQVFALFLFLKMLLNKLQINLFIDEYLLNIVTKYKRNKYI